MAVRKLWLWYLHYLFCEYLTAHRITHSKQYRIYSSFWTTYWNTNKWKISRQQSCVGKFNLGLPSCSPNISSSVILGMKPFKELLYSAQLKFYVRLSKQSNDRWSKDAFLDNICGRWPSPYIKMLGEIKQEVGLSKWPVSNRHVDIVLSHHFLEGTNAEIQRLHLPALMPLSKRQRMSHVNESVESQVCVEFWFHVDYDSLFTLLHLSHTVNIFISFQEYIYTQLLSSILNSSGLSSDMSCSGSNKPTL